MDSAAAAVVIFAVVHKLDEPAARNFAEKDADIGFEAVVVTSADAVADIVAAVILYTAKEEARKMRALVGCLYSMRKKENHFWLISLSFLFPNSDISIYRLSSLSSVILLTYHGY